MSFFRKKRVFAVLFILFIALLFSNSSWLGKLIYPIKYEDSILLHAAEHQVDPLLVAAIIRVESNYRPHLVSKMNATGLMQIMPDTADWVIDQAGFDPSFRDQIKEEDVNIRIGTWYIRSLFQQFKTILATKSKEEAMVLVAAAYNAGPGNVSRWLDQGIWDGTLENISQIPIGETRHYIQRVLYYYKKYRGLYADEWAS